MIPLTIASCLRAAKGTLPDLEAAILLAHALGMTRAQLYTWPEQILTLEQQQRVQHLMDRRIEGEPIAYLTGHREFWSLDFLVSPDTLIPRAETELLVETVLASLPSETPITLADLGTGCGAIALALAHECPQWHVIATDQSEAALSVAKQNVQRLHLSNVTFAHGTWCDALPAFPVDAIVSNPPYIASHDAHLFQGDLRYEPQAALVSGVEGLDAITTLIKTAKSHLSSKGWLFLEHGYDQAPAVRTLFQSQGYQAIRSVIDTLGHERITVGRL